MQASEGLATAIWNLIGYRVTPAQLEAFARYTRELMDWNARFNLTAITDPLEIEIKHHLDSISCLRVEAFRPPGKVVDIGSGAGFPGIPIKLLFPGFEMTLIESVGKKAGFCRHMTEMLSLQGLEVIADRAEVLGQTPEHRERYDWGLARAVAIAPVVLEYVLPFIKVGGKAILQKGESGPAEVQQAQNAIRLLGAEIEQIQRLELPGIPEVRYLIVLHKVAATPAKYPRRPGIPAKRPLLD